MARASGQATTLGSAPPDAARLPDAHVFTSPQTRGRRALGEPEQRSRPFELQSIAGGHALFAVSHVGGERVAWGRRIEGATGAFGPVLRFVDERIIGAFDGADGSTSVATSAEGTSRDHHVADRMVCIARYAPNVGQPSQRGCSELAPLAIVALGDRLALIDLAFDAPGAAPSSHAKGPRARHAKVQLRWASLGGEFDETASDTGLEIDRPFEGMTLIDAAARGSAVDLLWYETSPARSTNASHLGSAQLGVGTLREDGVFDPASRAGVLAADLDYGSIVGRRAPHLIAGADGTVLVTQNGRRGPCEALRVEPSLGHVVTSPTGCSIDPYDLAVGDGADASVASPLESPAFARILGSDPRRAPWQLRTDGELVAWAGDRAFFLEGGALRSADRATGESRDESAPFPARRSRVVWSAIARDGEGIAFGSRGGLHRIDPSGVSAPLTGATPSDGARAAHTPDPAGLERPRAARIGGTWWVARGDVVRLTPSSIVPRALVGLAHADATALVGGDARGLFLEVISRQLRVTRVLPTGELTPLARLPAKVRVGFAAVDRAGGGAIVAGVSALDPSKVLAFTVGDDGTVSASRATSLAVRPGDTSVRLVALPAGGALLADRARSRVVWLDDDATEVGAATWPAGDNGAICEDGSPARIQVPSPIAGMFAHVGAWESGACVAGEPTWARDGTLRWFGSYVEGLDAIAEAGVVDAGDEAIARACAPTSTPLVDAGESDADHARPLIAALPSLPALADPACRADMVSIAGRFCIDRYEAMLIDQATGEVLSPDYSATPSFLEMALGDWATGRARWGTVHARAFPLPALSAWQREATPSPLAVSRLGARPNGYVRGLVAEIACEAAGKRLCTRDEFKTACRGEDDTQFPYGASYVEGTCNVDRNDHPAVILHGNASLGHLDARLNRVSAKDGPLFQTTGASPACRSRWGEDAVYDLVGNLDEWVESETGAFAGGFYSRGTRAGCDALITAHPKLYLDYSTGVRCCMAATR